MCSCMCVCVCMYKPLNWNLCGTLPREMFVQLVAGCGFSASLPTVPTPTPPLVAPRYTPSPIPALTRLLLQCHRRWQSDKPLDNIFSRRKGEGDWGQILKHMQNCLLLHVNGSLWPPPRPLHAAHAFVTPFDGIRKRLPANLSFVWNYDMAIV